MFRILSALFSNLSAFLKFKRTFFKFKRMFCNFSALFEIYAIFQPTHFFNLPNFSTYAIYIFKRTFQILTVFQRGYQILRHF